MMDEASTLEFEKLMQAPPKLTEILASPLLYELFSWHLISRFNLLFRNAVVEYQDAVRVQDLEKARAKCDHIVDVFMGTDSVLEIPTRKSMQDQAKAGELKIDMFDEALHTIDRDLARSLQGFYEIPAFRSVMKHRAVLDGINNLGRDSKARSLQLPKPEKGAALVQSEDDPLAVVRSAFGTRERVILKRIFDVASPYQYTVTPTGKSQAGWARQAEEFFVFYDLEEKEVVRVPAQEMLGRARRTPAPAPAPQDDDMALAGCCAPAQPARSRTGSVSSKVNDSSWTLKAKHDGHELGPVPLEDLRLWWKYHLLPEETLIRPVGTADFTTVREDGLRFPSAIQITLVDPTVLNDVDL